MPDVFSGTAFLMKKQEESSRLCILNGETTSTTKEISLVFFSVMAYQSLPCVKGGGLRSKTEGLLKAKNIAIQSLSHLRWQLPLHKGALNRRFSADRGFGLLPDLAWWTSTRYACPGCERRENGKCDLIYLYFYAIISLKIKATLWFISTNTSWNNF